MNDRVSIIIPVHNVAEFLPQCLESVAAIDWPDKEIILVDDASTDHSGLICDEFCSRHPEARTIHFETNKGVAEARATGCGNASGAFVLFIDSDDWVEPGILRTMVEAAARYDVDVVCCRVTKEFENRSKLLYQSVFGRLNREDILRALATNLLYEPRASTPACPQYIHGKLYKREKISRSLGAGKGLVLGEDTMVWVDLLLNNTDSIFCLKEPLYHYRCHPMQITATPLAAKIDWLIPYWEKMDELFADSLGNQITWRMWHYLRPNIYKPFWTDVYRKARKSAAIQKQLWKKKDLPDAIRRSPHFVLLKHGLIVTDKLYCRLLWLASERVVPALKKVLSFSQKSQVKESYLYSVIIPHKNILDLLGRCVASIPRRPDIQVIVVDDASDIAERRWRDFQDAHKDICIVFTKEGKGAGYARNEGLKRAGGKWILFADADDFFYEGAFDHFDAWANSARDVLYFLADNRDSHSLKPVDDRRPVIREFIKKGNIDGLRYRSLVPWGKMIRRSLIEDAGLRFRETEVSNDLMFSVRLGRAARNPGIIRSEPLYCRTLREGSLTTLKTTKRVITRIKESKRVNDYLRRRGLSQYMIPTCHVDYFFPKQMLLYLWGVWMFRHNGDFWKNVWRIPAAVCYKLSLIFHSRK